jgi:hypothetical protein
VYDDAENVLRRMVQFIKILGFARIYRPYNPRKGPYIDEEVIDIFGEKFEGRICVRVVNYRFLAYLGAIELSCAHVNDEKGR